MNLIVLSLILGLFYGFIIVGSQMKAHPRFQAGLENLGLSIVIILGFAGIGFIVFERMLNCLWLPSWVPIIWGVTC